MARRKKSLVPVKKQARAPEPSAIPEALKYPKRRVLVHFYRAIIDKNTARELTPINLDAINRQVNARPWTQTDDGRYYTSGDESQTIMAWTHITEAPKQLRALFARELVDSDPAIESGGKLDFVDIDERSQRLIATSYAVLFEDNIMGFIGSVQGPTPAWIASYIQNMTTAHQYIEFDVIAEHNILERFARLKYLNKVDVTVTPGSLFYPQESTEAVQDPGAFEELLSVASRSNAKRIKILIETEKHTPIKDAVETIKAWFSAGKIDSASMEHLEVYGPDQFNPTGRNQSVNLLGAYVSIPKFVPRTKRALDPEAAFRAIAEAYIKNPDSLHEHPSVSFKDPPSED